MLYPDEINFQKERIKDMLRHAEHERFLQQVKASTPQAPRYAPVLRFMGKVLVSIGTELQTRYGEIMEEGIAVENPASAKRSSTHV